MIKQQCNLVYNENKKLRTNLLAKDQRMEQFLELNELNESKDKAQLKRKIELFS